MKRLILILAALCIGIPALAVDSRPTAVGLANSCVQLTMCDSEDTTGICRVGADTSNIVAFRPTLYSWVFNSGRSTAATYACTVVTNDTGATATSQDYTVPGLTINETTEVVWFDGFLHHFWVTCSDIADNVVIITATGCPLK